jgi:KaiC/GvpD/RAD55 family RecA-like ATPase
VSTAPTPGSDIGKLPPPPEPGTPVVRVVEYYTEVARRFVPTFDLELVPLSGKNPGVGGLAWQTRASSDPEAVLAHLKALGSAGRRVDGLGALMNRFITFDVDHPEHMPPELTTLVIRGLVSETRPGRSHFIFRLPLGVHYGARKDLINAAYPPLDGKSWGEIKGFNGQVRIWSPNDDGSHVRLVPGEIPMLPPELGIVLMEPTFYFGDPVTEAALDDWLDEHIGNLHPEWLADDVARVGEPNPDGDPSKNGRLVRRIYHVGMNIAAGAYPGRRAYEALHDAWVGLCVAEGDYITDGGPGDHERKHRDIWKRAVGKLTCDPKSLADIEAKKLKIGGGYGEPLDMDNPVHAEFVEWLGGWADREGVPGPRSGVEVGTLSADEVSALLTAVEGDEAEDSSPGGQVFDMAEMVAARLARLEAKTGIPVLPPTGTGHPSGGESSGPPEIVETRDEEIRGSTAVPAAGTPPEAVADGGSGSSSGGEPPPVGGSAPHPPSSGYEAVMENLLLTQREQIMAERDRLLRGKIAKAWIDDHESSAVLPTLHRERPVWTPIPAPDGLLRSDGVGLLYRSQPATHALIGGKGSGKSTLGAVAACEWMRAGSTVCWVDFEVGKPIVYNQFLTIRADPDLCAERLIVVAMSQEKGGIAGVVPAIEALGIVPGLVVLDSVSRAIARAGLNENDAAAFIQLVDEFADRLRDRGSSVLVIDHIGHEDKTRGRGTSSKGQQIDIEHTVEVLRGWSREVEGAVRIVARKDRRGYMTPDSTVAVVSFQPDLSVSDPDRRPLDVTVLPPGTPGALGWAALGVSGSTGELAGSVMGIFGAAGTGAERSMTAIGKELRDSGVRCSNEALRDTLEALVEDGYLSESPGVRGARMFRVAEDD